VSEIAELLRKEAQVLKDEAEWLQVKQAAVQALVQKGVDPSAAEQVLAKLREDAQ
jgi:hypothetical protein